LFAIRRNLNHHTIAVLDLGEFCTLAIEQVERCFLAGAQ